MLFHAIRRQFLTLLEVMIVLTIIGLVMGALAYNYMGSLDEGRAFKTKVSIEKLEAILELRVANDPAFIDNVQSEWRDVAASSPLVSNPKDLLYDGWGYPFEVTVDNGRITVSSQKYDDYTQKGQTMFGQ